MILLKKVKENTNSADTKYIFKNSTKISYTNKSNSTNVDLR